MMQLKKTIEEKVQEISGAGLTWINIERPSQRECDMLGQRYHFHQLELEDCLSKRQLNKIEQYEDHLFIILHFPFLSEQSRVYVSSQVSVFLGGDYLVTVHQGNLRPILELFQACKNDKRLLENSPGFLFYRILDGLVDSVFPVLEKVMADLEGIEDQVFDEKVEAVHEVTTLRRNIASLRRIVFPLRRVVADFAVEVQMRSKEDLSAHFRDITDHVEKAWQILEEAKETIEIYKDTDFVLNTERANKILAVLTMVFTLSIPATVISAFYGMNINLPGGIQTGAWNFLGPYTTFVILALVSVVPATLMLWYFHRLRWV